MNPDEANRQRIAQNEANLKELARRSHDIWRIYNPLDKEVNYPPNDIAKTSGVVNGDFIYYYDGYPQVVKSKQTKDVEFFHVGKYFKAIADFMIGQMAIARGNEIIERRRKQGVPEFLDKYQESTEVWAKVPRLDDPTLLKEIADKVVLGKVSDYGLDVPMPTPANAPRTGDTRPLHDQILGYFDKKLAEDNPPPPPEALPVKEPMNGNQSETK